VRPTTTSTHRLLALASLATATLCACGGSSSSSSSRAATAASTSDTTASTPTAPPAPTPTPVPTPAPITAPLIVQVENLDGARPQSGLSGAALVYEYETEGGISRFSAFFFGAPGSPVGPVRSARLATIKLLRIYGGSLLYSGASQYVSRLLATSGLRSYNETSAGGALFRVGYRFAPHNLYTDQPHASALLNRVNAPPVGYQLWARTDPAALPPGGIPAPRVTVPVSASEQPVFSYDAASHGYRRTEAGTGLMIDAASRAAWTTPNVVVLQVPVSVGPEVEDVSGTHGLDFGIVGSGTGQLIVGGQIYPIKYTQGPSGPPQLTLDNGSPAPIVPGQVVICLTRLGTAAH
jgi:hypothetical protein